MGSLVSGRVARFRVGLLGVAVLSAGLLVAACGSGSPGVAALGSTTTTAHTAAGSASKGPAKLVAFVHCMRRHGIPGFPMPERTADGYSIRIGPQGGVDPGSHTFHTAQAACRYLLPNKGAGPTITPADQADYLEAVGCMRSHGFPDFPDPTMTKRSVHFQIPPGINQHSKQFEDAVATCEKLIPPGLPYSGAN